MEHSVLHIPPRTFHPSYSYPLPLGVADESCGLVGVLINLYLDGDENRLSPRENRFHVFESQFRTLRTNPTPRRGAFKVNVRCHEEHRVDMRIQCLAPFVHHLIL